YSLVQIIGKNKKKKKREFKSRREGFYFLRISFPNFIENSGNSLAFRESFSFFFFLFFFPPDSFSVQKPSFEEALDQLDRAFGFFKFSFSRFRGLLLDPDQPKVGLFLL
ncbi:hypothetical protein PanWU01x14_326880, partial [Parasponia andersonii]